MSAAPPCLLCWLLLCSDAAIRSGTAAKLGPSHYDSASRMLTFRTKYQNAQQVPVTPRLAALLDQCKDPALPFVSQLSRGLGNNRYGPFELGPHPYALPYEAMLGAFSRLKTQLGITRKLTAHDLRRTTARNVYALTRDLRVVQALLGHSDLPTTMWYLQDNLVTVAPSTLELATMPLQTERPQ